MTLTFTKVGSGSGGPSGGHMGTHLESAPSYQHVQWSAGLSLRRFLPNFPNLSTSATYLSTVCCSQQTSVHARRILCSANVRSPLFFWSFPPRPSSADKWGTALLRHAISLNLVVFHWIPVFLLPWFQVFSTHRLQIVSALPFCIKVSICKYSFQVLYWFWVAPSCCRYGFLFFLFFWGEGSSSG